MSLLGKKSFYTVLLAAVFWAIWTIRNKVRFDQYTIKSHVVIIFTVCSFLMNWACLYGDEDAGRLNIGTQELMTKGGGAGIEVNY